LTKSSQFKNTLVKILFYGLVLLLFLGPVAVFVPAAATSNKSSTPVPVINSLTPVKGDSGTDVVINGSAGKISDATPGGTAESSTAFTCQENDVISTIIMTDDDLPEPPYASITFHITQPSESNPGTAEIRAAYKTFTYGVFLGVEDHQLWISHLPNRNAVPSSLRSFYDSLGINEFTTYADGKYRFTSFPAWIDIAKYDPDLVEMPELVSISSLSGQLYITYKTN
jgi:hypothetical protein